MFYRVQGVNFKNIDILDMRSKIIFWKNSLIPFTVYILSFYTLIYLFLINRLIDWLIDWLIGWFFVVTYQSIIYYNSLFNLLNILNYFSSWNIYRCFQKKYIVLGTTAMSMLLALTVAIILTINVFHITSTRHLHNDHYHGDALKSAESAEMYQKASIASDSGYCSEIGKNIYVLFFFFFGGGIFWF